MWGTDEPTVAVLVSAAANDDRAAWDEIVDRFTPLLLATARKYRLSDHEIADVAQTVWLHLVEHLKDIREPAALPGWLTSTTRHECIRMIGRNERQRPHDPHTAFENRAVDSGSQSSRSFGNGVFNSGLTSPDIAAEVAEGIDRQNRHEALLAGFAELPDSDRRLLRLLLTDPPLSYAQISEQLNIPIGSIGPTRGRALDRLRATAAVSQLVNSDTCRDR